MYEYKGNGKVEGIKIDTVLDDFNRLTLGESRGRPSRARGSNDPMPNERETMQEQPRDKHIFKEKQSRDKNRKSKTISN
jgi:hypothetical protein